MRHAGALINRRTGHTETVALAQGQDKTGVDGSTLIMADSIAIVTGGLRGLGRAMALGLLEQGHRVTAVGHIIEDAAAMIGEVGANAARLLPLVADLRLPLECDRVFAETRGRFAGDPGILVNNAGLTFTFIDPTRFRRETPQRFWECGDDIIQAVMDRTTSPPTKWPAARCR